MGAEESEENTVPRRTGDEQFMKEGEVVSEAPLGEASAFCSVWQLGGHWWRLWRNVLRREESVRREGK